MAGYGLCDIYILTHLFLPPLTEYHAGGTETQGAALPSGLQQHGHAVRHRTGNFKLFAHSPDARVPLLPGCGRMRVAREIYVGQEGINLSNLPQEVEVCQPVGRLAEGFMPPQQMSPLILSPVTADCDGWMAFGLKAPSSV